MESVSTIVMHDVDSANEAVVVVRRDSNKVALAISLRSNGDVELVMKDEDARALLEALQNATNS